MHKRLTKKQKDVMLFILASCTAGTAPTVREICAHFGFSSTGTARDHLGALTRKGYIAIEKGIARGIRILNSSISFPVLGKINAGTPEEAIEDTEEFLDIYSSFSGRGDVFVLKVKGNSMEKAGIIDGDLAVVRKQLTAYDGDIVAALIDGEALIKTFFRDKKGIRLEPASDRYKPIYTKDAVIAGKVIAVIRRYENTGI